MAHAGPPLLRQCGQRRQRRGRGQRQRLQRRQQWQLKRRVSLCERPHEGLQGLQGLQEQGLRYVVHRNESLLRLQGARLQEGLP